jgi:hypothetical protein
MRWFVAIGTVLVLGGCGPTAEEVVIECEGEVVLTQEECTGWGEQVLAGFPEAAASTGRLVLTYRGENSRCDADFYDFGGRAHAHESLVCPRL